MRFGDLEVVHSATILVREDEPATYDVPLGPVTLQLSVTFKEGKEDPTNRGEMVWSGNGPRVDIIFTGWREPLGGAVLTPARIGEVAGRDIYIRCVSHFIGGAQLAHMFVLRGGASA